MMFGLQRARLLEFAIFTSLACYVEMGLKKSPKMFVVFYDILSNPLIAIFLSFFAY